MIMRRWKRLNLIHRSLLWDIVQPKIGLLLEWNRRQLSYSMFHRQQAMHRVHRRRKIMINTH